MRTFKFLNASLGSTVAFYGLDLPAPSTTTGAISGVREAAARRGEAPLVPGIVYRRLNDQRIYHPAARI